MGNTRLIGEIKKKSDIRYNFIFRRNKVYKNIFSAN
jgi:hypothetical protein